MMHLHRDPKTCGMQRFFSLLFCERYVHSYSKKKSLESIDLKAIQQCPGKSAMDQRVS